MIPHIVSRIVLLDDRRISSIYTGGGSRTYAKTRKDLLLLLLKIMLETFTFCTSENYLRCFQGLTNPPPYTIYTNTILILYTLHIKTSEVSCQRLNKQFFFSFIFAFYFPRNILQFGKED